MRRGSSSQDVVSAMRACPPAAYGLLISSSVVMSMQPDFAVRFRLLVPLMLIGVPRTRRRDRDPKDCNLIVPGSHLMVCMRRRIIHTGADMKTRTLAATAAFALVAAAPAAAQSRSPDAFREAADAFIGETLEMMPAVPGLAITVVRGDSTIYRRGFGWADTEAGAPMTPETPLYIASNTKSFTALAAALLDARGDVDLDAPVTDYLRRDWFPSEIDAGAVTLRHLLTHTSGLSNDPLVFRTAYSGEHTPRVQRRLLEETVARDDAPLGTFDYTNTGYLIAALALEEATGLPWQDVLEREIFEPLGMAETTARLSELRPDAIPAAPYRAVGPAERMRLPLEKSDETLHAAGGIISTLRDLERWLVAEMHRGRISGDAVLPEAVIEATQTLAAPAAGTIGPFGRDGYGLGWIVGTFGGEKLIYHVGNFPGTSSLISFMPERNLGVTVFVNEDEVGTQLALMLTAYVYDWWVNQGRALEQLTGFRSGLVGRIEAASPPAAAATPGYDRIRPLVGTYHSDAYGTLYVSGTDRGELGLRIGDQQGLAASYEDGAASVAFIPGRADTWTFEREGDHAVRVLYGDWGTFQRLTPAPDGRQGGAASIEGSDK